MAITDTHLPRPYHGGFLRWLRECYDRGGLHGSVLIDRNVEHAAGRWSMNPADADDDLRKAEALGWLVRGKLTPTVSQRAFLGLSYHGGVIPDIHASCWYWELAPYPSPQRAAALAWLKESEAATLGIHRCAKPTCHARVEAAGQTCDRTDVHHV